MVLVSKLFEATYINRKTIYDIYQRNNYSVLKNSFINIPICLLTSKPCPCSPKKIKPFLPYKHFYLLIQRFANMNNFHRCLLLYQGAMLHKYCRDGEDKRCCSPWSKEPAVVSNLTMSPTKRWPQNDFVNKEGCQCCERIDFRKKKRKKND